MDCRILRQITLKADGHLGCDDSVGYGIDLGRVGAGDGWRLRDVLNGAVYRHVRHAFRDGRVPWPGVCEGCDLLASSARPDDQLDTRIDILVEPTLDCSLHCACCLRKQILRRGRSLQPLDPDVLDQLVRAATAEGIGIGEVHYIGWGEPLMHPDFARLFDVVQRHAPEARQMVTTAGNVDFAQTVGHLPLDRLVVSVDGARVESYAAYRRGGDLGTALKFMRDCRRFGHPGTFLEWKYILFEHNDSDAEIEEAQRLADEIGVDSLLFVITNSKWKSERFDAERAADVPLTSPRASVSAAAAMNTPVATARPSGSDDSHVEKDGLPFGHIDRCWVSAGRFLWLEGWALDADGEVPRAIVLHLDGKDRPIIHGTLTRRDVMRARPTARTMQCGFLIRVPLGREALPNRVEVLLTGMAGQRRLGGATHWEWVGNSAKRRADFELPAVAGEA